MESQKVSFQPHLRSINIGYCNRSGSVEVMVAPLYSTLLSSRWEGPFWENDKAVVALEIRRYFEQQPHQNFQGFVSTRCSTRQHLGMAVGAQYSFSTAHVGAYFNGREIRPTFGISFGWHL